MNAGNGPRRPLPLRNLWYMPELLELFVDAMMLHLNKEYRELCEKEASQ